MDPVRHKASKVIWLFGLGYFIFYAPYSALTKAISTGLTSRDQLAVSGIDILPVSALATVLTMFIFITIAGWWKHAGRRTILSRSVPFPNRWTFISGACMAVIIGTTTMAFSFAGISVVLVLVLLRGGTLAIGPLVDITLARKVRWFSWAAMITSNLALLIALADVSNYKMTMLVGVDVAAYLAAYFIRLSIMTRFAKSDDKQTTLKYFVEEQIVATPLLSIVLATLAIIGGNDALAGFRRGFSALFGNDLLLPALLVGVFYAALCVCTTLIFLDRRENTFCVPMHCGSSLLSGIVASYALYLIFDQPTPSPAQLASAALIVVSLMFLSPLHHVRRSLNALTEALARSQLASQLSMISFFDDAREVMPSVLAHREFGELVQHGGHRVLFVCSGNTCRSAMAEAIARAEISSRLAQTDEPGASARVLSAGISAKPGTPMTAAAREALQTLDVAASDHVSRLITPEMVSEASVIYCMTRSQYRSLIEMFPSAESKTMCLDPSGDIDDPIGAAVDKFIQCARQIQNAIRMRFEELGLSGEPLLQARSASN